jgi:hypothetical protein
MATKTKRRRKRGARPPTPSGSEGHETNVMSFPLLEAPGTLVPLCAISTAGGLGRQYPLTLTKWLVFARLWDS